VVVCLKIYFIPKFKIRKIPDCISRSGTLLDRIYSPFRNGSAKTGGVATRYKSP
jgi:hypothetical protein